MADPKSGAIDFCTLGMFIIDEIHFLPPTPPVFDIIGGAGAYSALGARLFSPPPISKSVGWIVDVGNDFPSSIRTSIEQWQTSCLFRNTPERPTTRGWNGYDSTEKRAFKYLTPKLRLDHDSLTPSLLMSRSFHLISNPSRCIDQVTNILARRRGRDEHAQNPVFIWEPVPDLCTPEHFEACLEALKYVQVVSPNHGELAGFFGAGDGEHSDGEVDRGLVERLCDSWLSRGIGPNGDGAIVVRAGKSGCFVATRHGRKWIPAYHEPMAKEGRNPKVIDPTGGGNGFLGGLAVGLVRAGVSLSFDSVVQAAIWGSVAASFAIEQVGMPTYDALAETWNGVKVIDRLSDLKMRLDAYVQP